MIFRNYLLINAPRVLIFDNVRKFARFLKMLLQPMLQLILAVYLLSLLFVLLPTWVELYICNITHRFFEQLSLPHRNEPWIEIFQVTLRSFFKSKNETIKIFFGFYINYKRKVKYILQKWFLQRENSWWEKLRASCYRNFDLNRSTFVDLELVALAE